MAESSKMADFFRKVGDVVLGVGKLPSKLKQKKPKGRKKILPKRGGEIPKMFKNFFERRHAGWPEYVMLKVQIAVLALFVTTVAYFFLRAWSLAFIPLMLAFSIYLVYLAAIQLRHAFERDYPAYRSFVAMCIAIAWVFVLVLQYSPTLISFESIYTYLIPPLLAIAFVAATFAAFRLKYGRNFTYGVVEQVQGRRAAVRVSYDICSNVKAGLYTVESFVNVRKGDLVKIGVERPMLGLRGAKLGAILGKSK